jgi:hypothetical protein
MPRSRSPNSDSSAMTHQTGQLSHPRPLSHDERELVGESLVPYGTPNT